MEFYEKLIDLRKKAGLSQEELAEQLDVSRQAISKWETKTAMPDIDKVLELSRVFAVSTDYLLRDDLKTPEQTTGLSVAEKHARARTRNFWKQSSIALVACFTLLLLYGLYLQSYYMPIVGVIGQVFAVGMFEVISVWDQEVQNPKYVRWSFYKITVWMLMVAPAVLLSRLIFNIVAAGKSYIAQSGVHSMLSNVLLIVFYLVFTVSIYCMLRRQKDSQRS